MADRRQQAVAVAVAIGVAGTPAGCGGQSSANDKRIRVESRSGDLQTLVANFTASIPRRGSSGYRAPSPLQAQQLATAFRHIAGGRLRAAAAIAGKLRYRVIRFTDTRSGARLGVLEEIRNRDGSWPHAWGLYIHREGSASKLTVEVAHPIADARTELVGVELFTRAHAANLFIAGAHRRADPAGAADVAHNVGSAFQAVQRAAVRPGDVVLQPHGFDEASHASLGEIVVSEGPQSPTALLDRLAAALQAANFQVCEFGRGRCGALGAQTNVQGRAARAAGATFVHIELARSLRDSSSTRDRVNGVLSSQLS